MTILLSSSEGSEDILQKQFEALLPRQKFAIYPHIEDPNDIEYAIIWRHPHHDLIRYPNLKAILSLAAGVDFILTDPQLPDVPIVRLTDPQMADDMSMYCLHWTIHFQRRFHHYYQAQQNNHWEQLRTVRKQKFTTAVLGLGEIGRYIASTLANNGFTSTGWSNSPKAIDNVSCYYGADGLSSCLTHADVLICCLPSTKDTKAMMNYQLLSQLKEGSFFINVSRGDLVNDDDLLNLINNKHIEAAVLDVFHREPLPADHIFWNTPNLFLTPHISGPTGLKSAAVIISENIKRLERGEQAHPLVDRHRKY